jgi:two-component system phosphate regulon sensor histidine kinase PhoR
MPRLPFFGAIASRLNRAQPGPKSGEKAPALPSAGDLLEALDQPVLLVRDRRVQLANRAALDLLGGHILGSDVRLAIRHPAAAERLVRAAAAEGEDEPPVDLAGLGEPDRLWTMATVRLGPDILVRLTDRSEIHAAERIRTDFVANASHELRTPLATLVGFLETLQDEDGAPDAETRARFLAIMSGEAKRMQQLVDDLMSLSRIEAERFRPPRETVDLVPLVEEARTNLAQLLRARGSEVVLDRQAGATLVAGDRAELLQLLANLLDNAAKYGGGEPVTVRIEDAPSGMIRLSVIDRGEGVAPEHLPHLTRRFYRADAGRSRAAGGTGLGLAIVKHIVERHRGRLDIRSAPGEGTEIRVWLPRAGEALS